MLNVFTLSNGRLFQEEIESLEELSKFRPIWVDLEDPTPEEKRWVKQYYGLSIPEDATDDDFADDAEAAAVLTRRARDRDTAGDSVVEYR